MLLAGVLFLSGCSGLPGATTTTTTTKTNTTTVTNSSDNKTPPATDTKSGTTTTTTTTTTGTGTPNVECMQGCSVLNSGTGLISRETCEMGCWIEDAKNQKNAQLCTNVTDSLLKTGCISAVAEVTGNLADCDLMGTSTEDLFVASCYITIAKQKNDASICDQIKNGLIAMGCKSDFENGGNE